MHYTYRIDFLDGSFYHGSKKNDKRLDPDFDNYWGSPVTHIKKWNTEFFWKTVLETFDDYELCMKAEKALIDQYWSMDKSLNRNSAGAILITHEVRAKMSAAHKGKTISDEQRQKLSASNKASWNDERRARMSALHKGKTHSNETKVKIGLASRERIRTPHSEETKAKIGAARKGRIWVNNNVISKLIESTESIPEGFVRGRIYPPRKQSNTRR